MPRGTSHRSLPPALGLTFALGAGCGDDGGLGDAPIAVTPSFSLGEAELGCADFPDVEGLEVTLFGPGGTSTRPGFPVRVDGCREVSVAGPEGEGVLEIRALGTVDGQPEVTLFRGRTNVVLPAAPTTVALRPEVAYVTLDWNFGDRMLAPCSSEVSRVDVIVGSIGAGGAGFQSSLGCTDAPIRISRPFGLSPHAVQVRAVSQGGFPIYAFDGQRVLDRGLNEVTAVMAPLGGQIFLDWTFSLSGQRISACDDARVNVTRITATVQGLAQMNGILVPDGSEAVVDRFDCATSRPAIFSPARFRSGRDLDLQVAADGDTHRFVALERFVMPDGDAERNGLVLQAVGTTTATLTVGAACAPGQASGYLVTAVGSTGEMSRRLAAEERAIVFDDLAYGSYQVRVFREPEISACPPVAVTREVTQREQDWGDIGL